MQVKFTSSSDLVILNNKLESIKTIFEARQKTHPNAIICYHKVRRGKTSPSISLPGYLKAVWPEFVGATTWP